MALPEGGDTALERIWVIVPGRGRRHGLRRRRPRRALREPRRRRQRSALNRGLWEHPSRERWQPGAGGLCLHSIATWPGEPDRLAVGISAAGVWLTDDGGATWRSGNEGIVARYLPEEPPEDEVALCVHRLQRAPTRPERLFMQFHGGVYRSDDAGADVDGHRGRPAVGLRLPAGRRSRRPRQRLRHPARRRHRPRHARRPRARLRDARRRRELDAARRRPPGRATRTSPSCARRSTGPARARRSSCTSARRRAPSSARATRGRPGSRWRRACRPCTRCRRPRRRSASALRTGISTAMVVPPPGGESTSSRPSSASTRSRSPRRPRAAGQVGAAHAVVADLHAQAVARRRAGRTEASLGPRVLRDVGQRLGRDEVGGGLDRRAAAATRARR